jgi:hypothetical protein
MFSSFLASWPFTTALPLAPADAGAMVGRIKPGHDGT